MSPFRPLALGYQSLRLDSSDDAQENGRRILTAYAEAEGYTLGTVYVERVHDGQLSAFTALIEAVAQGMVSAVIVPTLDDLGRLPRVRQAMQLRLEQVASLRVLVATA